MVGSVARMRVSSPMMPSFRGTLKSTRMNTRLPARSRSLIESFGMGVCEQDAVFNRHRNQAQRFVRLVQALPGGAIELPPVQRTFETGPFVVHGATLVWTDVRKEREPRAAAHEEVCPPSFGHDSGQTGKRANRPDSKDYSPFLTSSRSKSTQRFE